MSLRVRAGPAALEPSMMIGRVGQRELEKMQGVHCQGNDERPIHHRRRALHWRCDRERTLFHFRFLAGSVGAESADYQLKSLVVSL